MHTGLQHYTSTFYHCYFYTRYSVCEIITDLCSCYSRITHKSLKLAQYKIEVILLKIQVLPSVNLYFTLCFVKYLRINLADKMSLLLDWITYYCYNLSYHKVNFYSVSQTKQNNYYFTCIVQCTKIKYKLYCT